MGDLYTIGFDSHPIFEHAHKEFLALSQPVLDSDISPACKLQVSEWNGTKRSTQAGLPVQTEIC